MGELFNLYSVCYVEDVFLQQLLKWGGSECTVSEITIPKHLTRLLQGLISPQVLNLSRSASCQVKHSDRRKRVTVILFQRCIVQGQRGR